MQHQIDKMNIVPLCILNMRGKDKETFNFKVERNGVTSHLIASHHQPKLQGFKLTISTQNSHFNTKITNDKFSITLERTDEINNNLEMDVILGVCTYPANKTVRTFKILI